MPLTADREYGCINPDEVIDGTGGAADTLYKGGIMSFGTDGYVKVPAATANEVPMGLAKKQVVAAGANAEKVPICVGVLAVEKKSQHTTTILCGAGGTLNVNYDAAHFIIYGGPTGKTKYCVWCDVDSGSTDPTIADPSLGTGVEVDVGTGDSTTVIAAAIAAALDAIGGANVTFDGTSSTATATIVNTNRGANDISVTVSAVFTVTNTVYGNAIQADVGKLFYAIADDGVVYTAAKGSANVALGLCIGLVGSNNELWLDTKKKALG